MPFIPRYTPDYSELAAVYGRGADQLAALSLQRGQATAQGLARLAALFSGYQETGRQEKAAAAAVAFKREERAAEENQRALDRKERADERKEAARLARETQDRAAAARGVDDVAPGPVADTPETRVLMELAARFPETAARFQRTTTLPARALGVGEMAPPSDYVVRVPTGPEMRAAAADSAARERDAAARARDAKIDADRVADNARMAAAAAEAARHNQAMENKPPSMVPVVVQTPAGPAMVDRSTNTATPITMDGKPVGVTPTAAERMDSRKFSKAAPVLDGIKELSERINTLNGVIASAAGMAEKQKAKINLNDDVAEYEALVSGFTPMIARALGHTGVLTQQDVDSVKALFPRPEDSKSLRDRKINRMKSIIGQLEGVEGITPPADASGAVERWERGPDGKPRKVGG